MSGPPTTISEPRVARDRRGGGGPGPGARADVRGGPARAATLLPDFTNLGVPVFALVNLPELVKGALFARYSRSPKSLRRLFLDEFLTSGTLAGAPAAPFDTKRADELYGRMFFEYGDDSVAQLGGVHLACEGASNILTKVLEWGRLAAYLEQSTRYVPYDDLVDGRYRYHVPRELEGDLRNRYVGTLDAMFDTYRELLPILRQHFADRFPRDAQTSDAAYRMSIRAKALDTLRGLLPAATTSNVGIYGTGQAYENLLIRMRAHPLLEVRAYADMMLVELRKVIPAFLRRVDLLDRGGAWSSYLDETRRTTSRVAAALLAEGGTTPRAEVTLPDFEPAGEVKVVAAALYAVSDVPDDRLLEIAQKMTEGERRAVLEAYVGQRTNRRHRPGRAFERTAYRFDVLGDYGAFRDLQRHRLLTLEWQRLSPQHGSVMPEAIVEARVEDRWHRSLDASAALHDAIAAAGLVEVAPYAVAMAYG